MKMERARGREGGRERARERERDMHAEKRIKLERKRYTNMERKR